MDPQAHAALARAEALLAAQGRALRQGDADALAPLGVALSAPLAMLAAQARDGLPASLRGRVESLSQQAAALHLLAHRRAQAAEGALAALGQDSSRIENARLARTYGRTGTLLPSWRSARCESA